MPDRGRQHRIGGDFRRCRDEGDKKEKKDVASIRRILTRCQALPRVRLTTTPQEMDNTVILTSSVKKPFREVK